MNFNQQLLYEFQMKEKKRQQNKRKKHPDMNKAIELSHAQKTEVVDGYYHVERIEKLKMIGKYDLRFLIKWKGWDESENTWEPFQNLRNSVFSLQQFYQKGLQNKKIQSSDSWKMFVGCLQRENLLDQSGNFQSSKKKDRREEENNVSDRNEKRETIQQKWKKREREKKKSTPLSQQVIKKEVVIRKRRRDRLDEVDEDEGKCISEGEQKQQKRMKIASESPLRTIIELKSQEQNVSVPKPQSNLNQLQQVETNLTSSNHNDTKEIEIDQTLPKEQTKSFKTDSTDELEQTNIPKSKEISPHITKDNNLNTIEYIQSHSLNTGNLSTHPQVQDNPADIHEINLINEPVKKSVNELPNQYHNELINDHANELPNDHANELLNELPNEHANEVPNEHTNELPKESPNEPPNEQVNIPDDKLKNESDNKAKNMNSIDQDVNDTKQESKENQIWSENRALIINESSHNNLQDASQIVIGTPTNGGKLDLSVVSSKEKRIEKMSRNKGKKKRRPLCMNTNLGRAVQQVFEKQKKGEPLSLDKQELIQKQVQQQIQQSQSQQLQQQQQSSLQQQQLKQQQQLLSQQQQEQDYQKSSNFVSSQNSQVQQQKMHYSNYPEWKVVAQQGQIHSTGEQAIQMTRGQQQEPYHMNPVNRLWIPSDHPLNGSNFAGQSPDSHTYSYQQGMQMKPIKFQKTMNLMIPQRQTFLCHMQNSTIPSINAQINPEMVPQQHRKQPIRQQNPYYMNPSVDSSLIYPFRAQYNSSATQQQQQAIFPEQASSFQEHFPQNRLPIFEQASRMKQVFQRSSRAHDIPQQNRMPLVKQRIPVSYPPHQQSDHANNMTSVEQEKSVERKALHESRLKNSIQFPEVISNDNEEHSEREIIYVEDSSPLQIVVSSSSLEGGVNIVKPELTKKRQLRKDSTKNKKIITNDKINPKKVGRPKKKLLIPPKNVQTPSQNEEDHVKKPPPPPPSSSSSSLPIIPQDLETNQNHVEELKRHEIEQEAENSFIIHSNRAINAQIISNENENNPKPGNVPNVNTEGGVLCETISSNGIIEYNSQQNEKLEQDNNIQIQQDNNIQQSISRCRNEINDILKESSETKRIAEKKFIEEELHLKTLKSLKQANQALRNEPNDIVSIDLHPFINGEYIFKVSWALPHKQDVKLWVEGQKLKKKYPQLVIQFYESFIRFVD